MTLLDHLSELRRRLIYILLGIAICFIVLIFFRNDLYSIISSPLIQILPKPNKLIATEITSTLLAPIRLAFISSLIISAPLSLHQIWYFISPGLYGQEKKIALPVMLFSILLFVCGMFFSYKVVMPIMLNFFISVAPEGILVMPDINSYLSFVLKTMLAFGVAFETPIIILLLVASKAVSISSLSGARRYVVVGCFVVGMLLTPPDIFSQSFFAIPLWLLYELGLIISYLIQKLSKNKNTDKDQRS